MFPYAFLSEIGWGLLPNSVEKLAGHLVDINQQMLTQFTRCEGCVAVQTVPVVRQANQPQEQRASRPTDLTPALLVMPGPRVLDSHRW